jgi:hypothetical protein
MIDTGEQPSPLGGPKPSPLRRPREEPVDLHDLELNTDENPAADRVDFDAEFEDPFAGEPRIRRGAGLRSPTRSDLPPAPDLDFGPAPEFGFEGSAGGGVEEPDEEGASRDRNADPEREPRGGSDSRE